MQPKQMLREHFPQPAACLCCLDLLVPLHFTFVLSNKGVSVSLMPIEKTLRGRCPQLFDHYCRSLYVFVLWWNCVVYLAHCDVFMYLAFCDCMPVSCIVWSCLLPFVIACFVCDPIVLCILHCLCVCVCSRVLHICMLIFEEPSMTCSHICVR